MFKYVFAFTSILLVWTHVRTAVYVSSTSSRLFAHPRIYGNVSLVSTRLTRPGSDVDSHRNPIKEMLLRQNSFVVSDYCPFAQNTKNFFLMILTKHDESTEPLEGAATKRYTSSTRYL